MNLSEILVVIKAFEDWETFIDSRVADIHTFLPLF